MLLENRERELGQMILCLFRIISSRPGEAPHAKELTPKGHFVSIGSAEREWEVELCGPFPKRVAVGKSWCLRQVHSPVFLAQEAVQWSIEESWLWAAWVGPTSVWPCLFDFGWALGSLALNNPMQTVLFLLLGFCYDWLNYCVWCSSQVVPSFIEHMVSAQKTFFFMKRRVGHWGITSEYISNKWASF